MNTKKHLNPKDIQSLLQGDSSPEQMQSIEVHVEACSQCQAKLDEMAASPDLWQKASEFITDACISETIAISADKVAESPDPEGADQPWDYPIKHILDEPSHPEMLGRVGSYDIESEVGRGGMGVVFKAYDTELNRTIAIKVLAPHLAAHGAARKRFAREARAAAAVLHPNVIAIHGVANTEKTPYIAMPYIAGPSLQKLVDQNGPLDLKEIVRISLQIAGGLAAAHSQAVIHRDIKPANILIEKDVTRVVITDFGLARAENDATMTRTGWLAGTPNFMSPEQANGKRVDGRSDLFSLGSVIYFMATGRLPFRADSPMAILNRICTDQPTPVRQVNSDVSRTLSEIIEKLLQKDPDKRFQSAGDLHQTLEQYLAYLHQPDISKPPVINQKAARLKSAWIGVAMAGVLCLAIFGFNQGWFSTPDDRENPGLTVIDAPKSSPTDSEAEGAIVPNQPEITDRQQIGSSDRTLTKLRQQLETAMSQFDSTTDAEMGVEFYHLEQQLNHLETQLDALKTDSN